MWKKLVKYRALALEFIKNEIQNGRKTSSWFDKWTDLGRFIELTGRRGCIDMGISLNTTVAEALSHRRRRQKTSTLTQMETALHNTRSKGLTQIEDIVLWKGKNDRYKADFSSKDTWEAIRQAKPKVQWYKSIWFSQATPKYSLLAWLAIKNRLTT